MKDKRKDAIRNRKRYYERKAAGLCVDCGKRPPTDGKVTCTECREKRRERSHSEQYKEHRREYVQKTRDLWQSLHCCRICGKQDARTMIGKHACFDCLEENRERYRKRVERNEFCRKYDMDRQRQKEHAEKGLCTRCGKRPALNGFQLCPICRAKGREKYRRAREKSHRDDPLYGIRRKDWPEHGYCYVCGNPLDSVELQGMTTQKHARVCSRCYANILRAGERSRDSGNNQYSKNVDAFWKLKKAQWAARNGQTADKDQRSR